jgi:probable F420-dependent oxidoreductase
MALDIGRIGIWTGALDAVPMTKAQEHAAELEELGYGALWIPEAVGRESFTNSALLLSGTRRIPIATGITNMWGRDAVTMAAAQKTIAEAFPDRFLLGIGVSHANLVERLRGHEYARPYTAMKNYLDAMDNAMFMAVGPPEPPARVLAALGPKMLELAATRTLGAHPYFVPVEHTAEARRIMGPDALLAPEQAIVLETDRDKAYAIARAHMQIYLRTQNYPNNLRRLGYTEEDLADQGSDRLVEAIVAWGDMDKVTERIKAHHDAGANHVCVQVLTDSPTTPPLEQWRQLASSLL